MCLYHDFYGLFTVYLLYEDVMSVTLYQSAVFAQRGIQLHAHVPVHV